MHLILLAPLQSYSLIYFPKLVLFALIFLSFTISFYKHFGMTSSNERVSLTNDDYEQTFKFYGIYYLQLCLINIFQYKHYMQIDVKSTITFNLFRENSQICGICIMDWSITSPRDPPVVTFYIIDLLSIFLSSLTYFEYFEQVWQGSLQLRLKIL